MNEDWRPCNERYDCAVGMLCCVVADSWRCRRFVQFNNVGRGSWLGVAEGDGLLIEVDES